MYKRATVCLPYHSTNTMFAHVFWCAMYLTFLSTAADVAAMDFHEPKCEDCDSCYCVVNGVTKATPPVRRRPEASPPGSTRSRSTDLRLQSTPPRRSARNNCRRKGQRCRPCTICPTGYFKLSNCTATTDTVCSRCPDGQRWDRVRGLCKEVVSIVHEVHVVEGPASTTTLPANQEATRRSIHARHPNKPSNIVRDKSESQPFENLTEEADSEENSAGYIASLFVSGAAGISVIFLVILFIIYVILRVKRWESERSRPQNGNVKTWRNSELLINITPNLAQNDVTLTSQNTPSRSFNATMSALNTPSPKRNADESAEMESVTGFDDHQQQSTSIAARKSSEDTRNREKEDVLP